MKIGIIHYHLNRGGVTQVILNHLRALAAVAPSGAEPLEVVVLYGGRREAWQDDVVARLDGLRVSLEVCLELEYDDGSVPRPGPLKQSLVSTLDRHGLTADDTVLHIHNHALGKNMSLPVVVGQLAAEGYALLLQIHDFAEDFRPANYRALASALASQDPSRLAATLYPQGPAIHYAVLNGRDRHILQRAGVASPQLHVLPNPVTDLPTRPDRTEARRKLAARCGLDPELPFVLYPVRGIRRKNVGEVLLWSAVTGAAAQFAVTLPPLNPAEQPRYAAWRQQASELGLSILFDIGTHAELSFAENLAAADMVLTTSVAEGFGMVFLETWLATLPLVGRDLPEITADFVAAGVTFPGLSPQLLLPVDWIDRAEFTAEMHSAYGAVLQAYGRPLPSRHAFDEDISQLLSCGLLDFARCSARLQELCISQLVSDAGRCAVLRQLNPVLDLHRLELSGPYLADNVRAVRETYSLESSGMRLQQLYQALLQSPRGESQSAAHGTSILDAFLSLPRFQPIRID